MILVAFIKRPPIFSSLTVGELKKYCSPKGKFIIYYSVIFLYGNIANFQKIFSMFLAKYVMVISVLFFNTFFLKNRCFSFSYLRLRNQYIHIDLSQFPTTKKKKFALTITI